MTRMADRTPAAPSARAASVPLWRVSTVDMAAPDERYRRVLTSHRLPNGLRVTDALEASDMIMLALPPQISERVRFISEAETVIILAEDDACVEEVKQSAARLIAASEGRKTPVRVLLDLLAAPRSLSRDRLVAYMAAGIGMAEAAAFEDDNPPSLAALDMLAQLAAHGRNPRHAGGP